ncbi:MAG: hypothetical protein ACAF41_00285 (plasmid) [Leptolyngbya sp. BL-A-14]
MMTTLDAETLGVVAPLTLLKFHKLSRLGLLQVGLNSGKPFPKRFLIATLSASIKQWVQNTPQNQ